jgi:hypothetical protein
MDDLAGRKYCREGVAGGSLGTGWASSRNIPRRVVDEPFLAKDLRLAKEPFFGTVLSAGGGWGRPYLPGVVGTGGRLKTCSTGMGGRG